MRTVPRSDLDPARWDAFVDRHPWGWFWHTSGWLDYAVAYGGEDHSVAFMDGEEVRALVPLIREGDAFTLGGHPGPEPLLADEVDAAVTHDLIESYAQLRGHAHGVRRWAVRGQPEPVVTGTLPGWRDCSWQTYVLDLHQPEAVLWAGLRRSYHAIINRTQRRYSVLASATPWAMSLAHLVHAQAAGRETRSLRTWELMANWTQTGHAVVVLAQLPVGESTADDPEVRTRCRGMAVAYRYKDRAYYASGATLTSNLSHALIWHLITTLRHSGLRWFELGWAERDGDAEKDRQIAFFKSGFGGRLWQVPAMERLL